MSTSTLNAPPLTGEHSAADHSELPPAEATPPVAVDQPNVRDLPTSATPVSHHPIRTTAWINRQAGHVLGGWVRLLLMLLLAALIGVLLVRPPQSANSVNRPALAGQLATALGAQAGVSAATGSYLSGTGVVLVSKVTGTLDAGTLESLLAAALAPVKQQVVQLPGNEAVVWQANSGSSWLLRVPSGNVSDTSQWTVVPETAGQGASTAATATSAAASTPNSSSVNGPSSSSAAPGTAAPGAAVVASSSSGLAVPSVAGTASASAPTGSAQTASGSTGGIVSSGSVATGAAGKPAGPFADHFAKSDSFWQPLVGEWKIKGGTYQQTQTNGYDLISAYTGAVPTSYTATVRFRGLGSTSNAGLVLGLPLLGSRMGGTLVDLANQNYLRWGKYDATTGNYGFLGGVTLGATAPASAWQSLAVQVTPTGCAVLWNGKKVGTFGAISAGYVGLATSQSAAEFDDFTVTAR